MPTPPVVRPLADSAVLIGGGSSGVGFASARAFARAGSTRIALAARNRERSEAARGTLAAEFPDVDIRFVPTDGEVMESVIRSVAQTQEAFGSIDILVNSFAATVDADLLFRLPAESVGRQLTAPAFPPIFFSHAVYPYMQAQGGGAIITFSSDAAKIPTPGESVLGGAMAAIAMFSRGVALEGKRDGIRVNVVTPSLIDGTPSSERWLADGFGKKIFERARQAAVLGVVTPEDLADLVVFLASPAAAKMTGQTISMNGGISVS